MKNGSILFRNVKINTEELAKSTSFRWLPLGNETAVEKEGGGYCHFEYEISFLTLRLCNCDKYKIKIRGNMNTGLSYH